ncbi:MAG: peptidylprolyl isomerase [Acidimicrobiales bacterium]
MATEKRERQKANRARKLEQQQQVAKRRQWRRWAVLSLIGVVVIAGIAVLLNLTGGDDEAADDTTTATTAEATTSTTEAEASAVSAPTPGAAIEGPAECPATDGSSERTTSFSEAPPDCLEPGVAYTATFDTNLGPIVAELNTESAPLTVNNFVFLARYHYYDGSPFHRIIPGFVIQGGDATGDPLGTGSPGYTIAEEPPAEGAYQVGSLAMAKSPGPNATGAQFFIVTGPNGVALPPEYSLFGTVTEGMDVVSAIEGTPTNVDDAPTEPVIINSVTIDTTGADQSGGQG